MFSDVLEILEHPCKLILDDEVFTVYDNSDCEVFYVLHAVVPWKNALPDAEGVEEWEVLSVEESDPSEAVEKWINF